MGDLHSAFVVDKEVVKEHAQWRNPSLKARWEAARASATDGMDGAISAWIAGERNRVSGRELTEDEEKSPGSLVNAAKAWELNDRKKL